MRVLITGITGFAGRHLASYLLEHEEVELHGLVRRRDILATLADSRGKLRLWTADIRDQKAVMDLVSEISPAFILHLAAAGPGAAPSELFATNIEGSLHLLEVARHLVPSPRVVVVGSSAEYGRGPRDDQSITETTPLRPMNPYGVSKVAQEVLALSYWETWGLPAVAARAFNLTGPGERADRACSAFAKQLAEIELDLKEPVLEVGNLESLRDYTDVRDAVRAYWLLARGGAPGEAYNVASGHAVAMGEILERLISLSTVRPEIRRDPARLRPDEIPAQRGDATKCYAAIGWAPRRGLDETLTDLLNYWRGVVRASLEDATTGGRTP